MPGRARRQVVCPKKKNFAAISSFYLTNEKKYDKIT
jgi:hypothetical protein